MAQYFEDWSGSSVSDNPPAGWTKKWVTTQPFTVVTDADNPTGEGKSVEAVPTSSSRCALTWDAVDADADRATCDLIALIEVFEAANTGAYTYGGLVGRVSGSASSETGVTGSMGHSGVGATNHDVRVTQYSSGTLTTLPDTVQNTWVDNTRYWLRLTLSGTSARVRLYPESDPLDDGALLADHTDTVSVTGAGGVGIWSFTTNGSIRYLCVGVGTDGDLPPIEPLGGTGENAADGVYLADQVALEREVKIADSMFLYDTGAAEQSSPDGNLFTVDASDGVYFSDVSSKQSRGVIIPLYDGAGAPRTSVNSLTATWWDTDVGSLGAPRAIIPSITTDASSGYARVNLEAVTQINVGALGVLFIHKKETDPRSSWSFISQVSLQNLA